MEKERKAEENEILCLEASQRDRERKIIVNKKLFIWEKKLDVL